MSIRLLITLIVLTWRIWWAPNNANRWQMGFNSAFKGIMFDTLLLRPSLHCNTPPHFTTLHYTSPHFTLYQHVSDVQTPPLLPTQCVCVCVTATTRWRHLQLRRSVFTVRYELNLWIICINPLKPELNPICYLLALLGAHHFLHVNTIRVKFLTFRRLMSYIYGAPILDVSRSHTTTQHSR